MTSPTSPAPRRPMSDSRYRLLIALGLAGAAIAAVLAVRSTVTGTDDTASVGDRPEIVERLIPPQGDEVLRQTEVGIDLGPGYEGRLTINGVEIPDDELRLVPEQNQVFYLPGPDKAVETLQGGANCITAVAWKTSEGRSSDTERVVTWCFRAT